MSDSAAPDEMAAHVREGLRRLFSQPPAWACPSCGATGAHFCTGGQEQRSGWTATAQPATPAGP